MQRIEPLSDFTGKVMGPMIKGNLDQVHPAKLLVGLFKAQKSGALLVDDGISKLRLYFSDGCLIPFEENIHELREFAQFLVSQRMLSKRELVVHERLAAKRKDKLIDLLVERRVLERENIREMAEKFYSRQIIGFFSWRRGAFTFMDLEQSGRAKEDDKIQTLRWIINGIREKYHHGMIEKRLEKRRLTPLKMLTDTPFPIDELLTTAGERQVAQWIEKGTNLETIMTKSDLGPTDARALVFGLLTIEYCKFAPTIKARPEKSKSKKALPSDPLERLFAQAERSVDRIHAEVEREQQFAQPVSEEVAVTLDTLADELHRRLVQKTESEAAPPTTAPAASNETTGAEPVAEIKKPAEDSGFESFASKGEELPGPLEAGEEYAEPPEEEPAAESLDDLSEKAPEAGADELDDFGGLTDDEKRYEPDFAPELLTDNKILEFSATDAPDKIYQLAVTLIEEMAWSQARQAIQVALERGYENPQAKAWLGYCQYKDSEGDTDRFQKASGAIQEIITQNPKDALGYLLMGKIYLDEEDRSMAELYFIKALELDRDCVEAKELVRKIYQER